MRFINFLVVKLAACISFGIVLGNFFSTSIELGITVFIGFLLLLIIFWFSGQKRLKQGSLFGITTFLIFIALGYLNVQFHQPHFQTQHYSQLQNFNEPHLLQVKVREVLKPDRFYQNYLVEVFQLKDQSVQGTLLLNVRKETELIPFKIDELVLLSSTIKEIPMTLNPHQFDYKNYLEKLGAYHKITISQRDILKVQLGNTTIKGFSERIRNSIIEKLKEAPISTDAKAITQALVLGQRREISKELYTNYAAAGVIHILAVSGLHVGILFLFFSWLLKPLEYLRHGKLFKIIFIVSFLWGFAFLAGLSPSVVRAVTMFSFFALAGILNRPTNSFNTLFLSYLVLLLVRPQWLFHVGFQLSYLAVFFILWLQPKLYKIYRPRTIVDKYLWGIISVTLSAQLGVAPLSLYYFHQFPGLFLLTNLVVLPFLGIILGFGILIVILLLLDNFPSFLARTYSWTIQLLNDFVGWVASLESFLVSDISCSLLKMISIYCVIISSTILWTRKKKRNIFTTLASILFLFGVIGWEQVISSNEQLIIFHSSSRSQMGYKSGRELTVFSNDTANWKNKYPIKGYRIGEHISKYISKEIPDIIQFKGEKILRLDSLRVIQNRKLSVIWLSESPKINLERLIDSVQPKLIIADGSNYRSAVKRWKETCRKQKLPFHDTRTMGAYIFK